jgi:hypothetical protein
MKNILYILIIFFKINPIYALVVNEEVPVYYFVNQEKVINNLKEKLDKTNIVAVTGVTGVGKSELVRMFVKKYYQDYEIICFIYLLYLVCLFCNRTCFLIVLLLVPPFLYPGGLTGGSSGLTSTAYGKFCRDAFIACLVSPSNMALLD